VDRVSFQLFIRTASKHGVDDYMFEPPRLTGFTENDPSGSGLA
jgi:hypothetical protein